MPMAPSSVVREGDSRHHLSERWDHAELLQNQTSYRQKSTRSKLVEISTLVGDQLPELEPERVKFGTFSLGDVMAQEIQKFRRFAFWVKHPKIFNKFTKLDFTHKGIEERCSMWTLRKKEGICEGGEG